MVGDFVLFSFLSFEIIITIFFLDPSWPRIVREKLTPSKQIVCKLCTDQGNLEIVKLTRKRHGL